MRQFRNDYSEGAAPEILEALVQTNTKQTPGYGEDEFCARAADLVREACGQPDALVKFIPGGTAANILAISALTDEFEGPILAADAHPTIHETGAIEGTGRRLLATNDPYGILTSESAEHVWRDMISGGCHTTRPGMIYFSNTTEFGHAYTRAEFDALCDWAQARDMAVYVDGARMASALTSPHCDLTLEHLASRADAFTLGGTKAGMLFGEALVVSPRTDRGRRAVERIPYLTKRAGLLTAKGRLMGVQYQAALTAPAGGEAMDAPYWRYAAQSNACAAAIAAGMQDTGFEPYLNVTGNQQFIWATREQAKRFEEACGAETMVAADPTGANRVVVRFVTSWATSLDDCEELISFARGL